MLLKYIFENTCHILNDLRIEQKEVIILTSRHIICFPQKLFLFLFILYLTERSLSIFDRRKTTGCLQGTYKFSQHDAFIVFVVLGAYSKQTDWLRPKLVT